MAGYGDKVRSRAVPYSAFRKASDPISSGCNLRKHGVDKWIIVWVGKGLDSWTQSVAINDAAVPCQLGGNHRAEEQGLHSLVERRQKGRPACPTAV